MRRNRNSAREIARPPFHTRFERFGVVFVGVMIFGEGVLALLRGASNYANWWGGPIFAPFAILIGLLALAIAVVRRG